MVLQEYRVSPLNLNDRGGEPKASQKPYEMKARKKHYKNHKKLRQKAGLQFVPRKEDKVTALP